MPKLYIGEPMTTVSAALSSAMSSSDKARAAACCPFAGSAPRKALAASGVRCGMGVLPRSRVVTRSAGSLSRNADRASRTSWLETEASPSALLVRTRTVDIGLAPLGALAKSNGLKVMVNQMQQYPHMMHQTVAPGGADVTDLEDLRSFVEVVESGGFNRAAERLGISKSMVSRRIARLEAALGARLLSRTTRGTSPTKAGLEFKARSERILADLEEAREAVAQQGGGVPGRLPLSAPLSFRAPP